MLQTKNCRHGRLTYYDNDKFVGRVLDLYGEYSEGEVEIMRLALRPGDVAVEVGANVGALTVPLANIVGPSGRVIAFEPQPRIHRLLQRNLADNGITWADARFTAAGRGPSLAYIREPDYDEEDNFGGVEICEWFPSALPVPMQTVDYYDLPRLRLLKIDAEGSELDVLLGAERTIERCRPIIYVECDRKGRLKLLARHLAARDYRMWWHLPLMYQPDNFFRNPDAGAFEGMISMNVLAVPRAEGVDIPSLQEIKVREAKDDRTTLASAVA